jgi:CheY-like chemotaxis protein
VDCQSLKLTLEPFNIVGLIQKMHYIFLFNSRDKGVCIKYNLGVMQEWVIGDGKLLQMTLMKLVSYVIDSSDEGVNISLNMSVIETVRGKQRICISIVDDNIQIPSNVREGMFSNHNSELYVCKTIVEMHDGNIHHRYYNVRSKDDVVNMGDLKASEKRGNVFRIELLLDTCPSSENEIKKIISSRNISIRNNNINNTALEPKSVNESAPAASHKVRECVEGSLRNTLTMMKMPRRRVSSLSVNKYDGSGSDKENSARINIMVIDDSEISRKLMHRLVYTVCPNVKIYSAIDGLDALIKFIGLAESNITIHMILVDNVMPNLTGELLSKILRGIGYNGLILGITGNGVKEDRDKFRDNGADYVFIKPFTKKNLESILDLAERTGYLSWEEHTLKESSPGTLEWSRDL